MLQINTTQNVRLNFELANVGHRILAFLIDLVLIAAYLWVVFGFLDLGDIIQKHDDYWSRAALGVLFTLPVILYTLVSQIFMNGQTLGKKLLQIKVIKIDGFQASNTDFVMRWFFRLIDIYGFIIMSILISGIANGFDNGVFEKLLSVVLFLSPIAGFIAMVASKDKQRFGDMIAGTAVVSLKNTASISHTIIENLNDGYQATYAAVIKLSDNDARIIKETFLSAKKNRDYSVLIKLRIKIEEVTDIKNQERNDVIFIDKILKDYNYYTQHM